MLSFTFLLIVLTVSAAIPMVRLGISTGSINFPLGIPIVIVSHVSISMSYVFLILMGRIKSMPLDLQEASVDLGASWLSSIRDIVFPILMPAIIAGWLFAFMISWNEFIVTYFLIGSNMTLPVYIFSQLRFGISPKVNVISVLITLFTLRMVAILMVSRKIYNKVLLRERR